MSSPNDDHADPIPDRDQHSYWAEKLNITPIKENRVRWNNDWEKALESFNTARAVVEAMKAYFKVDDNADTQYDRSIVGEMELKFQRRSLTLVIWIPSGPC